MKDCNYFCSNSIRNFLSKRWSLQGRDCSKIDLKLNFTTRQQVTERLSTKLSWVHFSWTFGLEEELACSAGLWQLPRPSEGRKLFPCESTQAVTETRSDTWEGRTQETSTSFPDITLALNTSASNCWETTENKFLTFWVRSNVVSREHNL